MIELYILNKSNKDLSCIQTRFNGTVEQAKNYYKEINEKYIINETEKECIANIICKLLILDNNINYDKNLKEYSLLINDIKFILYPETIFFISSVLNLYDKKHVYSNFNFFNIDYTIKIIEQGFLKSNNINNNIIELYKNKNCINIIEKETKFGVHFLDLELVRIHKSGYHSKYKETKKI